MKIILSLFLVCVFAVLSLSATVTGRVSKQSGIGVYPAKVMLWNAYGVNVSSSVTNGFGFYQLEAPCCEYYVLTVSHRVYTFQPVLFNSAFGEEFTFNFVAQ